MTRNCVFLVEDNNYGVV